MQTKSVGLLETHYVFNNESHAINAFIRNQCERELLQIFYHSLKELDLNGKVEIEAIPPKNGSFLDIVQFLSENKDIVATIFTGLAIIVALLSRQRETKSDKILKQKQIEVANLDIKQKQLEIQKLKKELENNNDLNSINHQENMQKFVDLICEKLVANPIIARHISNFYQHLINYEKVQSIEYTPYDKNNQPIMGTKTVNREDFYKFIIQTSEDEIIDENAKIYIHSPMLVEGRKHWSGYYTSEESVINFAMNDKEFKKDVSSGTVKFSNGSFIYAVLRKTLKFDDFGNLKNQKYTVEIVTKISNDTGYTQETPQGKKYQNNRKTLNSQISINFED